MDNSRGAYARKIRGNPRKVLTNTEVALLQKQALKAAYGDERFVAKNVAEDAASSPRAAENWLAGENPMSLTAFLNLYNGDNKAFRAWARKLLLMEQDIDPGFQAELSRFMEACARQGAQP